MIELFGIQISQAALALGLFTGMTYGVLAVGLVLVYRSSHIVNFAHGTVGVLSAALLGVLVTAHHVPYWLAFLIALGVGGAVGGASEVIVVRRLRNAPSLMTVVATLGLAEFLALLAIVINAGASAGKLFPQPPGFPQFFIGSLYVTRAHSAMLIVTPILVLALSLFLRKSRTGVNIQAAAANPDAASLAGVAVGRMSTLTWVIAGLLSAYTAILIFPTQGFLDPRVLGPSLLLKALTAAVIARMSSLPIALAAGVGVGVVEELIRYNSPRGGLTSAVLFAVILVALLLQRGQSGRTAASHSWSAVEPWRSLEGAPLRVRRVVGAAAAAVALLAVAVPALVSDRASTILVAVLAFALVGLSVGVGAGLGGQLSLGQFAVAGVGATVSIILVKDIGNFFVAFTAAGVAGAVTSLVIGLPALRIKGLMLTVTSLAFALAAQDWLFGQPALLGAGREPGYAIVNGFVFDTGRRYYYIALAVFVVALWATRNIWRSGVGRRLRAVRDNEDAARAFSVPVVAVKLQGFAYAGFLAGLGGALYVHALSTASNATFLVRGSTDAAAMTVLGGVGLLIGPLLGALYIIGLPQAIPLDSAEAAATSLGWLLLILFWPGGIAQALAPARAAVLRRLGWDPRREVALAERPEPVVAPEEPVATVETRAERRRRRGTAPGKVLLSVSGLTKSYGGIKALDDVSFEVRQHEILGFLGSNGAGKTTLFELISGFIRPDAGRVVFHGEDITRLSADGRARDGLVRSFQDAALFPSLSVRDALRLSLERAEPTRFFASVLGLRSVERRKDARVDELIASFGLQAYADARIRELSTGTRRIVDLAAIVALRPSVLLLDEPSSGIAQRESEALAPLLLRLRDEFGMTLLVIEHDMPLLFGIADWVIAMESGAVIADASPATIREDDRVLASYLGEREVAIARSGDVVVEPTTAPAPAPAPDELDRCTALTRSGTRCVRAPRVAGRCAQHAANGVLV